jgi:hypothetical protein
VKSTHWRNWFRRKDALQVNVKELSESTQDLILRYDKALNAYKGMQEILLAGHTALLARDADDKMDEAIRDTVIALSEVPEPKVAVLGRVVCKMWTDPKYCWYEDHEACKGLTQLARGIMHAKAEESRRMAEVLYAPHEGQAADRERRPIVRRE